jgi:tryptophanase
VARGMYGPHICNEYIKGLDAFIDFVKKDILDNIGGNLCCPCKHCNNEKKCCTNNVLMSHLIWHGFMVDY